MTANPLSMSVRAGVVVKVDHALSLVELEVLTDSLDPGLGFAQLTPEQARHAAAALIAHAAAVEAHAAAVTKGQPPA